MKRGGAKPPRNRQEALREDVDEVPLGRRVVLRVQRMLVSVGKEAGEGQGEGRFPAQGVHQAGLEEGVGLGEDEAELSTRMLGRFDFACWFYVIPSSLKGQLVVADLENLGGNRCLELLTMLCSYVKLSGQLKAASFHVCGLRCGNSHFH